MARRSGKHQDDDQHITVAEDDGDGDPISKSERKRRMLALQAVGEELVALPADALKKFTLPEELHDAIHEARRINPNKHGGYARQMQYIGKLMREVDAAPIIRQLEELKAPSRAQTALHHLAESWRDRMLADPTCVGAFVGEFAEHDEQAKQREALAKTIASALEERAKGAPPKHFRVLYKTIHAQVVAAAARVAATQESST